MKQDESPEERPTQSAALPFRLAGGGVEVLLVTPRGGSGWIIPKGKIQARLGAPESARREAEEEAGVEGEIDPAPIDHYRHGGGEDGPLVVVFLLRVTREMASWPEAHERERRWTPLEDIPGLVIDPGLARVMRVAAPRLAAHDLAAWAAATQAGRRAARRRRLGLAGSAIVLATVAGLLTMAVFAG